MYTYVKFFKSQYVESESKYYIGNDYNYDQFKMIFVVVYFYFDFSGKVKENLIRIIIFFIELLIIYIYTIFFICIIYIVGGNYVYVLIKMVLFFIMGVFFRGWKKELFFFVYFI